ncbi:hypothetical protein LEP1GSC082_3150 [Leptospira kirschneri str. H2]|uniref:Uncharacterized protein n=1 Tax=Leptospira kirschneri str. H1 TaxID=1049966 RepID=A0A0E2B4P9_9LEPT|nr:hypothetical protein LEP1GSC081_3641 [Leptospira kirschneri str. H1]EKO60286.1 hypothetical protein LEP1GSC082_3150 [Leptospira kirschneri str. H2]
MRFELYRSILNLVGTITNLDFTLKSLKRRNYYKFRFYS